MKLNVAKLIARPLLRAGGVKCSSQCRFESKKKVKEPVTVLVQPDDERCFILAILKELCVPEDNSEVLADNLVFADTRGILTHGLARFPMYVKDIQEGRMCVTAVPTVLNETEATAWVDGNNGIGAVIGATAMKLAMKKAKKCGLGWVSCKGSNHFGVNSYYTTMAARDCLIGIAATNTSPVLVPTGGKEAALGTNPISIAAGQDESHRFNMDCSMTKVAIGKVERAKLLGKKIPLDWAMTEDGQPTDDPEAALKKILLLPSGAHKGYGLGAMVDIMSGVLAGANHSIHIPGWKGSTATAANLGQVFIAINPGMFVEDFEDRLKEFLDTLRSAKPINEEQPVLAPGDLETHFFQCKIKEGIPHSLNLLQQVNEMAEKICVDPLKFKRVKDKKDKKC